MGKIILHIGSPKTGSTAIQDFMGHNYDTLNKTGIVYPNIGREKGSGHTSFRKGLLTNYDDTIKRDVHLYNSIIRNLQDDEILVISSELLWTTNPKIIYESYPSMMAHTVIIVCYLRSQLSMIKSHIKQKVKSGVDVSDFQDFS